MVIYRQYRTTFITNLFGLIGKKKPENLLIKTRFGIHTFGVQFPIDVLILTKTLHVVVIKKLYPNRIFFWNPQYYLVLELPQGTVEKKKITIGDKITLIPPLEQYHNK